MLTENYRSTQVILDAAARLVSFNNPYRLEAIAGIDKRLRSSRDEGAPVRHLHHDTVSAEADAVAAEIAERLQSGARPRDVAILVRSNDDADPFLRALNVKGIPHRFSGSRGLYAREEVRLLVSFLRVLANPEDSVSLFYLAASEVYRVPEMELLRLNQYAQRKTRPLLEVLRGLPENEDLASVSGATRDATARLLVDVERAAAEVPRRRTGEVLYGYLQWSGLLGRLSKEASAEAEAKVRNIARFFEAVKAYGDVAEHDRVPAFVAHLELLRDAGDDPAVAEPDHDDDAVHVLTVHKAKGLEFPIVFLVGCAESKFPLQRRGEKVSLPDALLREEPGVASGHLHEERRLFYVAMTRAMDELVLTSAADYGTARARKVSRFVVEALDLPHPAPAPRKSRALEALARHQPPPEPRVAPEGEIPEDERAAPVPLPDRRLRDLPSQVPLRPRAAGPAPGPPHGGLRARDPRGGAPDVRGPSRRPHLLRGRPRGGVPGGLGVRGLPLPRARGAAPAGGGGDAAALLPRGDGVGRGPRPRWSRSSPSTWSATGSRGGTTSWRSGTAG